MIEVLVPDGHGELVWAEMPMPIAARMVVGVARVQAARLTDPELARAQVLFRDSLPMIYDLPHAAGRQARPTETGPVTWFGDHARFIVANWR